MNTAHIVEFEHPLPRMLCDGIQCGLYNNPELSLPGVLTTTDSRLGAFLQRLRETIMANRRLLFVDGKVIVCNHNWIRDHVQQMKGWMHWEYDPFSFLQFIIDTQRADTWDFTNDPASGGNRRIAGKPMCAMHGDNTGVFQAMNQLAWMNERIGNGAAADVWRERAETLRESVMKHLWNGRFFIHQLPIDGNPSLDGNEAERLSLSDAYALNRGILTGDECRAVIDEYRRRRETTEAFAEWFTIDPPYEPTFMIYKAGEYVNGAISPFTAGELAKGAFANGREAYGWNIVSRWIDMLERDKAIYFLYNRKTGSSISENAGPSAWGAAALMSAVDEGLAGVVDAGTGYDEIDFSPRWPVTHYREIRHVTGYELTKKYVDVRWIMTDKGMRYNVRGPAKKINAHILLPEGRGCRRLLVNGADAPFAETAVDQSRYVDCPVAADGEVDFEVLF